MEEQLERVVAELALLTQDKLTAEDLMVAGYETKHRTFRKRIGLYEICYRESPMGGLYEFAAIIKYGGN